MDKDIESDDDRKCCAIVVVYSGVDDDDGGTPAHLDEDNRHKIQSVAVVCGSGSGCMDRLECGGD